MLGQTVAGFQVLRGLVQVGPDTRSLAGEIFVQRFEEVVFWAVDFVGVMRCLDRGDQGLFEIVGFFSVVSGFCWHVLHEDSAPPGVDRVPEIHHHERSESLLGKQAKGIVLAEAGDVLHCQYTLGIFMRSCQNLKRLGVPDSAFAGLRNHEILLVERIGLFASAEGSLGQLKDVGSAGLGDFLNETKAKCTDGGIVVDLLEGEVDIRNVRLIVGQTISYF